MDETPLGKKVIKASVVLFIYLQFLSLLGFLAYWNTIGVDPSGYFSIQDVLVVSTKQSVPLFVILAFLGVVLFLVEEKRDYFEVGNSLWKGVLYLLGIFFLLVFLAKRIPAEWDSIFSGLVASICYFARYGVGNLIKPMKLDDVFGSSKKAFIYVSIAATGLVMAYPGAIYVARLDMSKMEEMATIYLLNDKSEYHLIGKIGDYHVVNLDSEKVMVVPNNRIDKIIHKK
ncbi:hypothetical protein [Halomonas halocynthiae]|uniref:hypothetical protein n=1 Tax=Halomonas halocynthiae TaxID=176290 RepID=UPI000401862D|nr:hypothetical protein [Halomonas halocynthiae]